MQEAALYRAWDRLIHLMEPAGYQMAGTFSAGGSLPAAPISCRNPGFSMAIDCRLHCHGAGRSQHAAPHAVPTVRGACSAPG